MRFNPAFTSLLLALAIGTHSALAAFSDTRYSWYEQSIANLQSAGIVSGVGDGTFRPDWLVTRAEMLKMALSAAKVPVDANSWSQCFPDVDPSAWYGKYVCTATKLGIAKGFASGDFRPNDTVTTLEALAFWLRAFDMVPAETGKNWFDGYRDFADRNRILPMHGYTLGTKIARGKAAELIENMGKYQATKVPISLASAGCVRGGGLLPTNMIDIDWTSRSYHLYAPSDYSKNKRYGLIVAIHGRTNSNTMVQGYMWLQGASGWRGVGTSQSDFIVAYPAGIKVKWGYSWADYSNVKFFDAILDEVSSNYCIDRDSIFVVGHSLWGWFSNRLACLRWDVINAMVSVWGPWFSGECTWPVASLLFQNRDDLLVSYKSWKNAESIRREENWCGNTVSAISVGSFKCKQWNSCASGNPVIWCEGYATYGGDPHSWPTGGGQAVLEFLKGDR